jgi:hypothetical protein
VTPCLEGRCSIRLSYGRAKTSKSTIVGLQSKRFSADLACLLNISYFIASHFVRSRV